MTRRSRCTTQENRRRRARVFVVFMLVVMSSISFACGRTGDNAATVTLSKDQQAIDSLLTAGDSVYRQSPERAGEYWEQAGSLAQLLQDSTRMARALTGLGQAAYQRSAFDTARMFGERGIALKIRRAMTSEMFRSYNALGLVAWKQDRLADAVELFEQAMNASRAVGDSLGVAKAMLNSGLVLREYAQFDRARATLDEASARLLVAGDSSNYARALNNLASLDIDVGDPQSALVRLSTARRLFAATLDSTGELNARGQLATAYSALGDVRGAFSVLDSAVELATRLNERADKAENLRITADLFLEAGDTQHALDYYGQAAMLSDSLGLREQHATIIRNQARALRIAGNVGPAYRLARQALVQHDRGGFRFAAMKDRLLLAELAQELGRPADAREHLQSARAIAASVDMTVATGQVALAAAQMAAARASWAEVLSELNAGSTSIDLLGSDAVATKYALRARAEARRGNSAEAIANGREAVNAIEQIRDRYDSGELRTRYITSKSSVFADLTLTLLSAQRDSEAFAVADAARGRAILEHLSSARASLRRDASTQQLSDVDQFLRRIDLLMARLRAREESTPRDRSPEAIATTRGLQDSLRQARSEYEALRSRRTDMQSAAAQIISPPLASIRQAQSALYAGELLVEYFATDRRLLIFLVSPTSYRIIEQPIPADSLGARIGLARALMGSRAGDDHAREVLSKLHTALLSPVIASGMLEGVKTLVVVPHGLLSYLPFSALLNPTTNRFLVEDVAVLVAPSAAVFTTLRATRKTVAGATRPSPSSASLRQQPLPKVYALAPFSRALPGSFAELRGMRQSVFSLRESIDGAATELALRKLVQEGAIVHLATHAVMNPGNPLFSRIELARGSHQSSIDDGRLEVHEILGLDVSSTLVFLSGCETALGGVWTTRFEDREDYTSLAHAWLVAGARNVVATLWRIDDNAAAEFTRRFYLALPNATPHEAMAMAQREMIRDTRLRRPYLWAAYQTIGDGRSASTGGQKVSEKQ